MISIILDENIEEQKANIAHLMETGDERTVQMLTNTTFKVGQKISLNVEITDEFLSGNIFSMLYNPSHIPGVENLGFKLNSIGPTLDRDQVVNELHMLTLRIQSGEFNKKENE